MFFHRKRHTVAGIVVVGALGFFGLTACSTTSSPASTTLDKQSITVQTDNSPSSVALLTSIISDFEKVYPAVSVTIQTHPAGADGDNLIKTKLATGTMSDVLLYNSGSLFQALAPAKNFTDLSSEPWVKNVDAGFRQVVSSGGKLYGAPAGPASGGGIFYNKKVYADLGLKIPKTWKQLISNSEKIKAAGKTAVIETFGDSWSAQLLVLGDYSNVAAAEPKWAAKYTENKAHYGTDPVAREGFDHLAEVHSLGLMNPDYASAKFADGLKMLATGEGAQYPMLTQAAGPSFETDYKADSQNIGFFAEPGSKSSTNPLTTWEPGAAYVTKASQHQAAATAFVGFIASPKGCGAITKAIGVTGPYLIQGCTLPAVKPGYVSDMLAYFNKAGGSSAALEFLSPVKGPSLPQIAVAVGSGISDAKTGALQYDRDVKAQAQQLGLPGW